MTEVRNFNTLDKKNNYNNCSSCLRPPSKVCSFVCLLFCIFTDVKISLTRCLGRLGLASRVCFLRLSVHVQLERNSRWTDRIHLSQVLRRWISPFSEMHVAICCSREDGCPHRFSWNGHWKWWPYTYSKKLEKRFIRMDDWQSGKSSQGWRLWKCKISFNGISVWKTWFFKEEI